MTTNPSLVAKEGMDLRTCVKQISEIVDGPISAEAMSMKAEDMVKEGRELAAIHENINVKLPMCIESLKATKKLVSAGFSDEEVETLLPTFIAVDDKSLDSAVDNFIKVSEARVKHQVDSVKETLLDNATPPATPTNAPVDMTAEALKLAQGGDIESQARAAELLLQGAQAQ